jgi:hypothetical protein
VCVLVGRSYVLNYQQLQTFSDPISSRSIIDKAKDSADGTTMLTTMTGVQLEASGVGNLVALTTPQAPEGAVSVGFVS